MHQLIQLTDPPERITRNPDPRRAMRLQWDETTDGPLPELPAPYRYVPIEDRPAHNAVTQRVERELTSERDGWRVVDLTADEIRARTVPAEVTRRQLLLVLASQDPPITREAIRSMLAGNEAGLIEFEEAMTFRRDHPLIGQLAGTLGLDEAAVDSLFTAAAQL